MVQTVGAPKYIFSPNSASLCPRGRQANCVFDRFASVRETLRVMFAARHFAIGIVLVLAGSGHASSHDYYKGKTIRFVVAFSPGGTFDAYTRVIARHFGKHVPGNPTIVVENMTGAGGFIQANFMYQRAKPDGLTIGNNQGSFILQQILGARGIEFDSKKFEFIGVPTDFHPVCALTRASGLTSMERWFAAKEPAKLGGIGPGTGPSDVARAVKAALPTLPARVIDGYKGAADVRLAADAGELAGFCAAWEGIKLLWRKSIDSGEVSVVLQIAPKKHPELANVPLAIDYAKTEEAKQILKYAVQDVAALQYLYFLPPATHKEIVRTLRKSFVDTLKDPDFLTEMNKANLAVTPVAGETIDGIVSGLFKLDAGMVAKLKSVLVP